MFDEPTITVTVSHGSHRDVVEADTPEEALFAARYLFDEWCDAHPVQGWRRNLRVTFWVDDQAIRTFIGTRP